MIRFTWLQFRAQAAVVEYPTVPQALPASGDWWDSFFSAVSERVAAIVPASECVRTTTCI